MITVKYQGGLGNQLWQYSVGRILAQRFGYRLSSPGITGMIDCPPRLPGKKILFPKIEIYGHFIPDHIENKRIIMNGYFERYEYVQPHMVQIKNWFTPVVRSRIPDTNSLTISIRRGSNNWPVETLCPNMEYYIEKIGQLNFEKNYICTDAPEEKFIVDLASQVKNCEIIKAGALEQFSFLQQSEHIFMAPSTFSWWAAMTGNAKTIFWPTIPALDFRTTNYDWYPYDHENIVCI